MTAPWTDVDRDQLVDALHDADLIDALTHRTVAEEAATVALDTLTAAGWCRAADERARVAEEIAQHIEVYAGTVAHPGTCAWLARQHAAGSPT